MTIKTKIHRASALSRTNLMRASGELQWEAVHLCNGKTCWSAHSFQNRLSFSLPLSNMVQTWHLMYLQVKHFLHNTVTYGTCFHVVPLFENCPQNRGFP